MLTLLTTFTSIAIAVPAPHYLQSEDAKRLQHDKEAPSLYNDHQAEGADKFSSPGNGSAAASKHEIAMAAPVDVGYDPCSEDQDVCKKWCAKNTKSWPNKCTFSKYCAGCTQCASVDDEQAFCLAVTAPWATKCAWEKCHGHAQCTNGAVPCESPTPSSESSCVFNPTFEITYSNGTIEPEASLQDAIGSCADDDYSEACYIANVGCAPNAWDVSAVKSMSALFYSATSYNQDLADWDVSAVTTMASLFGKATSFNQDLADWDVSAVKVMGGLFKATSYNQDLADWDVSAVTTMANMFNTATSFNQGLADWDVSAVKYMGQMFVGSPMSCNLVPTELQTGTGCTA